LFYFWLNLDLLAAIKGLASFINPFILDFACGTGANSLFPGLDTLKPIFLTVVRPGLASLDNSAFDIVMSLSGINFKPLKECPPAKKPTSA
jgi:hypothetical protein